MISVKTLGNQRCRVRHAVIIATAYLIGHGRSFFFFLSLISIATAVGKRRRQTHARFGHVDIQSGVTKHRRTLGPNVCGCVSW